MNRFQVIILIIFLLFFSTTFASILDDSFKIYKSDADVLFMSALSALSQSDKYQISEIQTKNGYILFKSGDRYYLLTLTKRYKNQTEVKILPQNSDYSQGATVANSVFRLIDEQLKRPMELVK